MDVEQINSFMSNADREEVSYSDAQWLYLQDVNQGSYVNNIQYQTTTLKMQFIDYQNAYVRMPLSIEVQNSAASTASGAQASVNNRPPTIALRQSLLNLFTDIRVTTDQGQTIVNDINTQMINNIRLEVENDEGWMRSEGPYLDYAYDRFNRLPTQTLLTAPGQVAGGAAGSGGNALPTSGNPLVVPNYWAAQGIEAGFGTGNPPLTNDPNKFGNNTLADFPIVFTAGNGTSTNAIVTSISGFTPTAAVSTASIPVQFSDGRIALFPYTTGTTQFLTLGGVTLSTAGTAGADGAVPPLGAIVGSVFTREAVGYTNVLNQPVDSELVTIPLQFYVVSATTAAAAGTSVLLQLGGVPVTTGTTGVASAYGQVAGLNPNANLGFLDRVTYFQNSSAYVYTPSAGTTPNGVVTTNGAHTYYYVAVIPLKLLHDFFRQLDFPIINVGFVFQFTLAQNNGPLSQAVYPPFQVSNNQYLLTGGGDSTASPSIYYGRGVSGASEGTRLYYRVVKFSAADTARVAEKLSTGFTKSIKFISTDWIKEPTTVGAGANQHQFQFSTSVVHPLRTWVVSTPFNTYGTSASFTNQAALRDFLTDPTYAPGVMPIHWTQTNILINSIPYFRQNQMNYQDQVRLHIW